MIPASAPPAGVRGRGSVARPALRDGPVPHAPAHAAGPLHSAHPGKGVPGAAPCHAHCHTPLLPPPPDPARLAPRGGLHRGALPGYLSRGAGRGGVRGGVCSRGEGSHRWRCSAPLSPLHRVRGPRAGGRGLYGGPHGAPAACARLGGRGRHRCRASLHRRTRRRRGDPRGAVLLPRRRAPQRCAHALAARCDRGEPC